jgi:hypothetical protein
MGRLRTEKPAIQTLAGFCAARQFEPSPILTLARCPSVVGALSRPGLAAFSCHSKRRWHLLTRRKASERCLVARKHQHNNSGQRNLNEAERRLDLQDEMQSGFSHYGPAGGDPEALEGKNVQAYD